MKILLLDIETAPLEADVWSLWNNNVGLNQVKHDWYILSWSAKWLGQRKIMYRDQRHAANIEDDSVILAELHALMDEADIVVAHNGDRFDVPKINARFIKAGLLPPSPYRQVDTLKIAKFSFKFTSNRLAYLGEFLNIPQKKLTHHRFPGHMLWTEVRKGNMKAWQEMERYNRADVLALEAVYLKLRAWDKRAPNAGPYVALDTEDGGHVCPICGSVHTVKRGFQYTQAGKFQRYQCTNETCGAWSRDRINLLTKRQRRTVGAR